jgi:hypothetical protein
MRPWSAPIPSSRSASRRSSTGSTRRPEPLGFAPLLGNALHWAGNAQQAERTSWQPWTELFRDAGCEPAAPEWSGIPDSVAEARAHPERIPGHGITHVADTVPAWLKGHPLT